MIGFRLLMVSLIIVVVGGYWVGILTNSFGIGAGIIILCPLVIVVLLAQRSRKMEVPNDLSVREIKR